MTRVLFAIAAVLLLCGATAYGVEPTPRPGDATLNNWYNMHPRQPSRPSPKPGPRIIVVPPYHPYWQPYYVPPYYVYPRPYYPYPHPYSPYYYPPRPKYPRM